MNKKVLSIFFVIQILMVQVISYFPDFVECYYSLMWYPFSSNFFRIITHKVPFSLGDVVYCFLIFSILYWFFKHRKSNYKHIILSSISALSIGYFIFHLLWGGNYYRVPLYKKMALSRDYTVSELLDFSEKLIVKINDVHTTIEKNDTVKISNPDSHRLIFEKTMQGYEKLGSQYSYLSYHHVSIKPSLWSLPLTYMGISGYLNPFTNEAHVNTKIPLYIFPTVSCHEIAHQIGYASESDANFIGYLASIHHDDLYFQYSGYVYALTYCLQNWKYRDSKVYQELIEKIHPGILKNMKENTDFWKQYHSSLDGFFHFFYDTFLKMNRQKEGLETYGLFLNLLINYYKNQAF